MCQPRRSFMAVFDPIFQITIFPYIYRVQWHHVSVKRISLLAFLVPFCGNVRWRFKKWALRSLRHDSFPQRPIFAAHALHSLLSLVDESICHWLSLVRRSPYTQTLSIGRTRRFLLQFCSLFSCCQTTKKTAYHCLLLGSYIQVQHPKDLHAAGALYRP